MGHRFKVVDDPRFQAERMVEFPSVNHPRTIREDTSISFLPDRRQQTALWRGLRLRNAHSKTSPWYRQIAENQRHQTFPLARVYRPPEAQIARSSRQILSPSGMRSIEIDLFRDSETLAPALQSSNPITLRHVMRMRANLL